MQDVNRFIIEIKEKREFLQNLVNTTKDNSIIKNASLSLLMYLNLEHDLAHLGIFLDDQSKEIMREQVYRNKVFPYLLQFGIQQQNPRLNLDYVNSLLEVISKAYSFSIPTLNIDNQVLIDYTKQFYLQFFSDTILQEAINLLENSNLLFLERNVSDSATLIRGRSYMDPYYKTVYSVIQRQYDITDYGSLAHEILHGIHFLLNPNIINSISEVKEVGSNMIEFLYYDFLSKNSNFNSSNLKKIYFMSIANEATILKRNLNENCFGFDINNSFLLLEAKIVGYGMAKEYLLDPKQGKKQLQKYMYHDFLSSYVPDYSFFGYSKEKILKIAGELIKEREDFLNKNYKKSL